MVPWWRAACRPKQINSHDDRLTTRIHVGVYRGLFHQLQGLPRSSGRSDCGYLGQEKTKSKKKKKKERDRSREREGGKGGEETKEEGGKGKKERPPRPIWEIWRNRERGITTRYLHIDKLTATQSTSHHSKTLKRDM